MRRLERVQNTKVWTTYKARRQTLQSADWQEVLLFHGSSKDSIRSISRTGFMTCYSRAQNALFFAEVCSTSLGYSAKDGGPFCQGDLHAPNFKPQFLASGQAMLLCRVLVPGNMQVGYGGNFTISNDDFAYPEYIIHFEP